MHRGDCVKLQLSTLGRGGCWHLVTPLTHAERCIGALKPRIRPFAIYDATISYPLRGDTIPAWVAIVIPFALMAISLCIGELILFKRVRAVIAC